MLHIDTITSEDKVSEQESGYVALLAGIGFVEFIVRIDEEQFGDTRLPVDREPLHDTKVRVQADELTSDSIIYSHCPAHSSINGEQRIVIEVAGACVRLRIHQISADALADRKVVAVTVELSGDVKGIDSALRYERGITYEVRKGILVNGAYGECQLRSVDRLSKNRLPSILC